MRGALALAVLAAALVGERAPAAEPIAWDEADHHVGEEATVEGRVLGIHCSPLSCLLAFEPTFNRFTAVIQAASFDKFPPREIDDRYSGKRVRVTGRIETRDGKPEIVVDKPEALTLIEEKEQPAAAPETARAQTEVLERLADVLARVEELTARMAATQERLDALLAQMEQRELALAAALASQAPPPPPEQPQRPAYQALRSIKRGMAAGDVQRLLGQPQYVDDSRRGWSTWYYGDGRSLTFDDRGRVQSLAGFQ
jgi:uncharacterized coiled-coil protein SlyX